ncbi:MAG: hypothetical protein MZV64_62685 [Ignavibacteriales bacterium]|nr:hypothetical protein [Ignavibacteriales bacterium]
MHLVRDSLPEAEDRREVTKVAVIGIGQSLRGDDAAGLEAVRQWREKFPETASRLEVQVEAGELPGLALLDVLNDVDARAPGGCRPEFAPAGHDPPPGRGGTCGVHIRRKIGARLGRGRDAQTGQSTDEQPPQDPRRRDHRRGTGNGRGDERRGQGCDPEGL